jgi:putative transposase
MSEDRETIALSNVVRIDDERIRDHPGQIVRAQQPARSGGGTAVQRRPLRAHEGRRDTRAGSYPRKLHTRAGEVMLRVPKLRQQTFETAIIECYRRRERR